jgi:hypothetical protein
MQLLPLFSKPTPSPRLASTGIRDGAVGGVWGHYSIDVRGKLRRSKVEAKLSTTYGPYDLHGIPLAEDDLSKLLPTQYGAIIGHSDEFDVHVVATEELLQRSGFLQLPNLAVDCEGDYP